MSIEIRRVREDELSDYVDAMSTAFLDRPDVGRVGAELQPLWDLDRTWAAFDGARICGTFRSFATELTVVGRARLPAAAVAAVTVLPTHRRRGILTQLAAAEHGAIRERGEALAVLYASEYPIYGRFGYGPSCRLATWTLDALATSFHGEPVRGVELVRAGTDARDAMMAAFDASRMRQPGEIRRRDYRWDFDLGLRDTAWGKRWVGFLALRRDDAGTIDGYVRYRVEEKWEQRQPRSVVTVDDLHALTEDAYRALWQFLAELDLVSTIKAEGRRASEPLPWLLTNARAVAISDVGDGLWCRLFDVQRALEARTYDDPASLVLEVVDREAAGGCTRFHLDAGPDGATCTVTNRSPDLTLDVSALGAAYLGGVRLCDAVVARGVDEHRAGALAAATALFRTADEPWCSTFF